VSRFLADVWSRGKLAGDEVYCLMNLAMAASYDPDPDAPNGFRLPFNLETGELIPARWREWMKHDPINLVRRYRKNLPSLRGLFIDCGWRDQYHMQSLDQHLIQLCKQNVITLEEAKKVTSSIKERQRDRSGNG
jgi:hypothetical protein